MEIIKSLLIAIKMLSTGFRFHKLSWGGYSIDFKEVRQLVDFDESETNFHICCGRHMKSVDKELGRITYEYGDAV